MKSRRHSAVLGELTEWREDACERGIGSRVVLLAVPSGWGRSAVLRRFRDESADPNGPVVIVAGIDGAVGGDRAVQAVKVREQLANVAVPSRAAGLLDVDRPAGRAALGLELGGLFAPGLPTALALLVAAHVVRAMGKAWDDGPAGEVGAVARAARAAAAVSVKVPVVVVIDDADQLDPGLARALITGLAGRCDGQVLVVAAADPGSALVCDLARDPGFDLAGRVLRAEAEPGMEAVARASLAWELLPDLPDVTAERIGARTAAFTDVFAVAAADLVAALGPGAARGEAVAAVDAVVDAVLAGTVPSPEAAVLAWARGALAEVQADRALAAMGAARRDDDGHVRRSDGLVRLADPGSPRCAEQAAAFSPRERAGLAAAILDGAAAVAADPGAGLVERVVARQAVHRVRGDLASRDGLARVQCALVRGLERLGDPGAALEVVRTALEELPSGHQEGRRELLAAYRRLAGTGPGGDEDPLITEAVEVALVGGAATGLEARTWAAVSLLGRAGKREQALALAEQVAGELRRRADLGAAGDQWRLLLGYHAGRAGHPALTQRLLAGMITAGTADRQKAAQAVLRAVGGSRADTRLQIIVLEAELGATPGGADEERLRIHAALAAAYSTLGGYRHALSHGQRELALRRSVQGPAHPATLGARNNVASWTGECGNPAGALRLFRELLADQQMVLGPDHLSTLLTRNNIAAWMGLSGDATEALRMSCELLTDRERILGPDHPDTLATRCNIAFLTGECGDAAEALRLSSELLPDVQRVLGPDHPYTLTTRNNIATWTGSCRSAAGALRLSSELLPDVQRVLGPDHPNTLTTRSEIARWTGECGDAAEALRMSCELLADRERILGPDHPDTLATRARVAYWTGQGGETGPFH